ncbi:hypothetical protein [Methylocystis sp.]|uniref:hypothetical protein n=1 Tax=Methylocystis sp. TaxID=1911079 RepID=UPI003D14940C
MRTIDPAIFDEDGNEKGILTQLAESLSKESDELQIALISATGAERSRLVEKLGVTSELHAIVASFARREPALDLPLQEFRRLRQMIASSLPLTPPIYDRAAIMRDAHRRYRDGKRLQLDWSFGHCLSTAWRAAKARAAEAASLERAKRAGRAMATSCRSTPPSSALITTEGRS